jgi:hypothetical protein
MFDLQLVSFFWGMLGQLQTRCLLDIIFHVMCVCMCMCVLLLFLLYYEMKLPKLPLLITAQQQRGIDWGNLMQYEVTLKLPKLPH